MRSSSKKPIINEHIEAEQVRLVGVEGEQLGIVSIAEAREAAAAIKHDLVLIAPDADPVVCKLMDYGKHIFELKKQKAASKKKQRRTQVKEIKFRPGTEHGDKVRFIMQFRGREMAHQHLGMELVNRIRKDLEEFGTVEQEPKMEGRQIVMVLAPVKKRPQ